MEIYVVIRNVDNIKQTYRTWAYSFLLGVLTKGWGEGFGWSKDKSGNWVWKKSD